RYDCAVAPRQRSIERFAKLLEVGENVVEKERYQDQIKNARGDAADLLNTVLDEVPYRLGHSLRILNELADLIRYAPVELGVSRLEIGEPGLNEGPRSPDLIGKIRNEVRELRPETRHEIEQSERKNEDRQQHRQHGRGRAR